MSPDAGHASVLVEELRGASRAERVSRAGRPGGRVTGDVVVLAVWYAAVLSIRCEHGEQLDGDVVVNVTNWSTARASMASSPRPTAPPPSSTGRRRCQRRGVGQSLDLSSAGDNDEAKAAVLELVEGGGLRAIDASRSGEHASWSALGLLHMTLQDGLGTGHGSDVKVVG